MGRVLSQKFKSDVLSLNWKDDHHLYEILEESRKCYFDLHFPFINREEERKTFISTLNFIKEIMKDIGAPFNDDEVAICGVDPNKTKSSYHINLNNNFLLNGMSSVKRKTKGQDNLKELGRPSQKPINGRDTLDEILISHNLSGENMFIKLEGQRQISGNVRTS